MRSLYFCSAAILATVGAYAAPAPHTPPPTPVPSAPRTVTFLPSQPPPVIHAALLQSTLIELPPEEKVATVFGGDTVDWVFDGGHVASRYLSIKPKIANATTDVHIISDHGNEYTLQLEDTSTDSNPSFDSTIFLEPGDTAAKKKIDEQPVFLPAAQVEAQMAELKKEAAAGQRVAEEEKKAAATEAEQYRSKYPGSLSFDYKWNHSDGDRLGVQQIWHDAHFTYIKGVFNEPPVLYETTDKKGSIVNFDFSDGLYTASKIIQVGYLQIGKEKMTFTESRKDGQ